MPFFQYVFRRAASAPAPTVSGARDVVVDTGGGGRQQYIFGTGFVNGATISVSGTPATAVSYIGPTELRCTMPASTAGLKNIVVTNPDTQTSGTSGNNLVRYWGPANITSALVDAYFDSRKGVALSGSDVTTWTEQIASRVYATDIASRPTRVVDSFGTGVNAIRFVPTQFVNATKRGLNGGLTYLWVGKWTSSDASESQVNTNAPLTMIADAGGGVYHTAGMSAGSLSYQYFNGIWVKTLFGSGLNDGSPRLVGFTHELDTRSPGRASRVRAFLGSRQQGADHFPAMFTAPNMGYTTVGAGYLNLDGAAGDFGAVIILGGTNGTDPGIISDDDMALLDAWARQSFDTPALPAFDALSTGPALMYVAPNYNDVSDTWTSTSSRGPNVVAAGSPGPTASSGKPVFNIVTDFALVGAGFPLITTAGKHYMAKVTTATINSWGVNVTAYTNPLLIGESGQFSGLHLYRTGAGPYTFYLIMYDWDSGEKRADVNVTSLVDAAGNGTFIAEGKKVWNVATASFDLFVRAYASGANPSAWTPGATGMGNTGGGSTSTKIGPVNGTIHCAFGWSRPLSDTVAAQMATLVSAL